MKPVRTAWIGLAVQGLLALMLVLQQVNSSRLPKIVNPHPYKDVNMPRISSRDIDRAFDVAKQKATERKNIESNMANENGILSGKKITAQARHQKNNFFMPESRELDNEQEKFQQASLYLKQIYHLDNDQAAYGLSRTDISGSSKARAEVQQCQSMFSVRCANSKFRTADASCNNLDNPVWGKSFTCFARLVPPNYADGLSAPRVSASGGSLPNPRFISLSIHNDVNIINRNYTHMTMQWGQFLDHDLTITPMNRAGPNMDMIECCDMRGNPHPECFPIDISPDDPFYSQFRERCMNFVRSATCTSDCTLGPRQQTNQLTAPIDGSNIYGSRDNDTRALRTFRGGLLKFQTSQVGELLPPSRDTENDQCSRPATNDICFQAGDERVNEQPGLTAMHTLWLRQHNRIARIFASLFPRASDEELFQQTRKVIGAQLQMITYNEFLPVVLGPEYMKYFKLYPLKSGYTSYDPTTQLSIVTEFSTAAYRFGHTLIRNNFGQFNPNGANVGGIDLQDNFFFPFGVFNGQVEALLQGLFRNDAQQYDRHIVQAVTNHLYKQRGTPFGMDLPALNIQRSRDHGISGYTTYVDYCFDVQIKEWRDLYTNNFMTPDNVQRLANVYRVPADIDLFTGGVSEIPLDGGVVGPTFGCIIGLQFFHLKYGDRYYFEHGGQTGSFTSNQLNQIRSQTTLAEVICLNTNIVSVQGRVFQQYNDFNNLVYNCQNARDIDFRYWG